MEAQAQAAAGGGDQHNSHAEANTNIAKSPSDFSCHSYELFVGQEKGNDDNNKEKMSIKSEGLESVNDMSRSIAQSETLAAKVRKVRNFSLTS